MDLILDYVPWLSFCSRMALSSVVFPAPKNPDKSVTGTGSFTSGTIFLNLFLWLGMVKKLLDFLTQNVSFKYSCKLHGTGNLTGYLPMSQKVGETQNRQFSRNLCHSTLSWSRLTTQNILTSDGRFGGGGHLEIWDC